MTQCLSCCCLSEIGFT